MIYRHCQRCGKRILAGQTCPCMAELKRARDKVYDTTKRNKQHTAFYASSPWLNLQRACRDRYANLDIYMLYNYGRVQPGRIAHHIIPLEDDWNRRLDFDNLIYVSDSSHQEIHKIYRTGSEEKKDLQNRLRSFRERWIRENGAAPGRDADG